MAIALGFPIVRYDFFVLFRAHNRYTLQFQVGSIRFEENGHIDPTLVLILPVRRPSVRGISLAITVNKYSCLDVMINHVIVNEFGDSL